MGIYHVKQRGEELKDDELITFGLAGNQNCGKTTLFNQLTGSISMLVISQELQSIEKMDRLET